jgi:WD40 repeat protein
MERYTGRAYLGCSDGSIFVVQGVGEVISVCLPQRFAHSSVSCTLLMQSDGIASFCVRGHTGQITHMQVNERYLMTSGVDGKVIRWETSFTADAIRAESSVTLSNKTGARGFATPDFQRVVVGTSKRDIVSADLTTGVPPVDVVCGTSGQLLCVDAHPVHPLFVVGSSTGLVSVWNYETKRKIEEIQLPRAVTSIRIHPDGDVIVCALGKTDGKVQLQTSVPTASPRTHATTRKRTFAP